MTQDDIQVTSIQITDTFRFGGRTYYGLEDLRKHSITSCHDKTGMRPFAVRKTQSYPCFDSSDSLYEDRYYQAYFLTMDKAKAMTICEEDKQYPVMEPMFSMEKIQECHLPYIYYHGEGDTMEIVQDRNAKFKVEVITSRSRFNLWRNDSDPIPCLYGPPTDISDYDIYI